MDMERRRKTTLVIDDLVMRRLREEAARRGCTISELVEEALLALLEERTPADDLPDLPSWSGGQERVDIANRDSLSDLMEGP